MMQTISPARMITVLLPALLLASASLAQGIHGRPAIRKPAIEKKLLKPAVEKKPSVNIKQVSHGGPAPVVKTRPPINMKEFKSTRTFSVRQASYASNFTSPSKSFQMNDGSRLTISLKKSTDGGQADHVSSKQSTPVTEKNGGDWKCVTSSLEINAQSTNFGVSDYQKQAANIYPGAIYTFENLMNGSFRAQPGARNPIVISTDNKNISGDTYLEVANPSQATIQNGVAALYRRFSTAAGNGATTMQLYESYNTADWVLKLNAGGSAWGVSVNNSFNASDKSQHRYLTIDVKKTLFTINTLPPEKGFFTNAAAETSAPNMMFISSVSYGVRILANLEVTFKSAAAADAFNAKYKAGIYGASVDLNYMQNNSSIETKINAYIVGGPNEGIITLDRNKLITSLNKILSGANYQNAQAISYSLCNMAGDVVGSESATDRFTYRNCVPAENSPVLTSAIVNVQCGRDGKDRDTHFQYQLYSTKTFENAGFGKIPTATYINNTNNTRFENNSLNNANELAIRRNGKYTLNDFFGKGCLSIYITPNGHDEWQIDRLTLTLGFSDGTTKRVSWSKIVLSHEKRSGNFYFQGGPNSSLVAVQ